MAVKITEHPLGHMIDFGDDVRIERTHMHVKKEAVLDKSGHPLKTKTGQPIHTHVPHVKPRLDVNRKPVYEKVLDPATGQVLRTTPALDHVTDKSGELIWMWNVYQRVANPPDPEHDGHFIHAYHGEQTTETHTWLWVIEGTEAEARAKARELVGE